VARTVEEGAAIRASGRTALGILTGAVLFGAAPFALANSFGSVPLRVGTTDHADVRILQLQLERLGYDVAADGVFGPSTQAAVMAFQRSRGLPADGVVGLQTFRALAQAQTSRGGFVRAAERYVVQPGDTLFALAQRFGTTVAALAAANDLSVDGILQIGQVLTIPAAAASGGTSDSLGLTLVHDALQYVGTPYVWGGSSPSGFDCSGFVQYVAHLVGVDLPRTSQAQYLAGSPVPPGDLAPGDLVFFDTYGWASHVGIYIGDGEFVSAPGAGATVSVASLDGGYWGAHFIGARRIVP
jgi:LysM repeat protein